jgi:hypothetical protein
LRLPALASKTRFLWRLNKFNRTLPARLFRAAELAAPPPRGFFWVSPQSAVLVINGMTVLHYTRAPSSCPPCCYNPHSPQPLAMDYGGRLNLASLTRYKVG